MTTSSDKSDSQIAFPTLTQDAILMLWTSLAERELSRLPSSIAEAGLPAECAPNVIADATLALMGVRVMLGRWMPRPPIMNQREVDSFIELLTDLAHARVQRALDDTISKLANSTQRAQALAMDWNRERPAIRETRPTKEQRAAWTEKPRDYSTFSWEPDDEGRLRPIFHIRPDPEDMR